MQFSLQALSFEAWRLRGEIKQRGLDGKVGLVSVLVSPAVEAMVGEATLKGKHTPQERPDGVSGQTPPMGQAFGFEMAISLAYF